MADDAERIKAGEGAKFNSAIADLMRHDLLLRRCNDASTTRDFVTWVHTLNALYREIAPYLNNKENDHVLAVRIINLPPDRRAWGIYAVKLDLFEQVLRHYRAVKKLGIVAEEDASTAALR